jgi:hypothetical protein
VTHLHQSELSQKLLESCTSSCITFTLHIATMSAKAAGKKRAAPIDEDVEEDVVAQTQEGDAITSSEPERRASASASTSASTSKPKSKKRKTLVAGIVYISRLPPGMTPQKVKDLMARWGDVGKIYAQKRDGKLILVLRA